MSRGSSDDGGGGGGDTDGGGAGRSDDDRSLSSSADSSVGGVGNRSRSRSRSRSRCRSSSSANSNNNNGGGNNNIKKETASADEGCGAVGVGVGGNGGIGGGIIGAAINSGFNFFELPATAAAMPPYSLEVRNNGAGGVWTKAQLQKGVRYGPFLGKWGPKPLDSRFAWEVRVAGYSGYLDGTIEICNWLKFIRSTNDSTRQNVRAFLLAGQIFYELIQTVRASEELLLGKREPLNLDAAFGELMATSAEDRSERDSVVASQNSLGSIDGDADADGDAEEPEEDDQNRCILCEKCFPDIEQLDDHLVTGHHYKASQYGCELCPQSYSWKPCLIRHLALAHSRKFTCETCSKVFSDPSNLQRHIRTNHAGARSHACSECGKTFATSSGLKQHTHIHSSVKPFQCEVCFKAYTQFSNLCRHKRMHADCRMQVKCDRCDQSFSTGTSLSKHKRFCESNSLPTSSSTPTVASNMSSQQQGSSTYPVFPRYPLYPPHPLQMHSPFYFPAVNGSASPYLFQSPITHIGQFAPKHMDMLSLLPGGLQQEFNRFKRACSGESEQCNETPAKKINSNAQMSLEKTPPSSSSSTTILMGSNKTSPLVGEEASSNQRPSPARPNVVTYPDPKVQMMKRELRSTDEDCGGPCDLSVNITDIDVADETGSITDRRSVSPPADGDKSDQPLDLSVTKVEKQRRKSPATDDRVRNLIARLSSNSPGCKKPLQKVQRKEPKWSAPSTPPPSSPYSVSNLIQTHPKPLYLDSMYPNALTNFAESQLQQLQTHHHQAAFGHSTTAVNRPFPFSMLSCPSPAIEHFLRQPIPNYPKPYQDIIQHGQQNGRVGTGASGPGTVTKSKDRYACNYCGKVFPRSANLTRHVRTHTGEQPYRCAHCERSFSISSNLQRHVRNIHRQERNFKCNLCNRRFSQQTNLDRHVKKHEADDGTVIGTVTSSSASSMDEKEDARMLEIRSFMHKVSESSMVAEMQNNNIDPCLPDDGLYAAPL